jgi:RNA polymerase sigma-70 factor (ECF subfamily)
VVVVTSSASQSVADLLAQARAGVNRPLEQLFATCRNYLTVVARAQLGTELRAKVDASDLVQLTLMEAYCDFATFRGTTEAEWLAWLRRILRHNAANLVRHYAQTGKRLVRREVALRTPADGSSAPGGLEPNDHGETPSQQLIRRERELLVADALTYLPEDYREVIVLRNLERLSFDEVAQRLGRSRPAVQMLWMRALVKLQEVFAKMSSTL